jgi:hypothetical protein
LAAALSNISVFFAMFLSKDLSANLGEQHWPKMPNCNARLSALQVHCGDRLDTSWPKQDISPSKTFVWVATASHLWIATDQMSRTLSRRTKIRPGWQCS